MPTAHANRQTTTCSRFLTSFRMGSDYLNGFFSLSLVKGWSVEIESKLISLESFLSYLFIYFFLEEMSLNWFSNEREISNIFFSNVKRKRWFGKSSTLLRHEQQLIRNRFAVQAFKQKRIKKKNETTIERTWIAFRKPWKCECQKAFKSLLVYSFSIWIVFNDI